MGRLDELCDERGHIGDLYSELNKWSFESKWSPRSRPFDFASDSEDKTWLCEQVDNSLESCTILSGKGHSSRLNAFSTQLCFARWAVCVVTRQTLTDHLLCARHRARDAALSKTGSILHMELGVTTDKHISIYTLPRGKGPKKEHRCLDGATLLW